MAYQRTKEENWNNYSLLPSVLQTTPNAVIRNYIHEYMNTLPDGVAEISNIDELSEIKVQSFSSMTNAIETLGYIFDYKLCLLIDSISVVNANLNSVLFYMDEFRESYKNPKNVAACTYRYGGITKLSVSLFDKALELFLNSLELDDTDFFVNMQVAKIYLYCNCKE